MASTNNGSSDSLLTVLHNGATALLSSGAALLSGALSQPSPQHSSSSWWPPSFSNTTTSSRSLSAAADEFVAHLRWSTPLLQPSTCVPLPTVWDARTILAFVDCLRSIQHSFVAVDDSSINSLTVPPVSAALVAGLLLVFTRPGGVALRDVALCPYCVVERHELWRLLSCHAVHLDAAHLLTNISALLPDCAALEASRGSLPLLADLSLLALTASAAFVGTSALLLAASRRHAGGGGSSARQQYYGMLTVGASSLGFALKVWAGSRTRKTVYLLSLVPIPAAFTWVPTLALTHLLVPQASFSAHVAGVCAGLCRAYCIEPVLQRLRHAWQGKGGSSSSRVASGGRLGGGAGLEQQQPGSSWRLDMHRRYLELTGGVTSPTTSSSTWGSSKQRKWLQPCTELLLQLGCVAAAVAVHAAVHSSGGGGRSSRLSSSNAGGLLWR